jgi:hypothetical protein
VRNLHQRNIPAVAVAGRAGTEARVHERLKKRRLVNREFFEPISGMPLLSSS